MNEHVNLAAAGAKKQHGVYWLFGLLAALGLLLVVLLATLLFGQHGGEEFSPDTFSRRSFYYFQIPLLGFQVTPIFRDDTTNALENYLLAHKFIIPNPTGNPRWDLVTARSASTGLVRGDAEILCSYLDTTIELDKRYWQRWSDLHPESARILWPLIAQLARRQLYLFVPELFDWAERESDPELLARELHRSLARQYVRLAEIQEELGHRDKAFELRRQADQHALEFKTSTGTRVFRLPDRKPSRSSVTKRKPNAFKPSTRDWRVVSSIKRPNSASGSSSRAKSPLW